MNIINTLENKIGPGVVKILYLMPLDYWYSKVKVNSQQKNKKLLRKKNKK
jgi:hypothetical protein